MADNISALAEALYGASAQKEIAASNPYYSFTGIPSSISDMLLKTVSANPDKYSLKEALPYAVGSGLLSGLLSTLGDSYQTTLTNRYQDAVMKTLLGQEPSGEGLRPSLFKSAQNVGDLFKLQTQLSGAAETKTFERERFAKLQDKLAENGYLLGSDGSMSKLDALDPNKLAANKKAAETSAQLRAENDFWKESKAAEPVAKPAGADDSEPIATESGVSKKSPLFDFLNANPKSPQYQAAKDQLGRTQGLESDTYNRVMKLPTAAQFAEIDANFQTLLQLAKENSRPASIGMISSLARIWDPGGTVREGEFALNSQAQSKLDSVYGDWRAYLKGEGNLSDAAKASIIKAAAQKYNEFGKKYQMEAGDLYNALRRQGGDPENIPVPKFTPWVNPVVTVDGAGAAGLDLSERALAELARRKAGK